MGDCPRLFGHRERRLGERQGRPSQGHVIWPPTIIRRCRDNDRERVSLFKIKIAGDDEHEAAAGLIAPSNLVEFGLLGRSPYPVSFHPSRIHRGHSSRCSIDRRDRRSMLRAVSKWTK